MSKVEKVSIALTLDMAAVVRGAVASGDYASSSEVVREALRDWRLKRNMLQQNMARVERASPKDHTLLDKLRLQKAAILALAEQYGARRLRIFGSVARREERPDSDIDIVVDFPQGYSMLKQRLPLANRLEDLTGRKIDLVPEHELNKGLKRRVLGEAVEL
jgi:predicted nucleotidyltransferase